MRRLIFICLGVGALALPAVALAMRSAPGDGTLVVQNGSAPRDISVVKLALIGTAVGHVSTGSPDQLDTVVIYDQNNTNNIGASAGASGAFLTKTSLGGQKTKLVGSDFRFRAADGAYTIWIYGSGVDLFAVGNGKAVLQGLTTGPDGRYSVNGGDWHSLPAAPSDWLQLATSAGSGG